MINYKYYILFILFLPFTFPLQAQETYLRIVANPINLNYRFQPGDNSYREAADPVLEYYKEMPSWYTIQNLYSASSTKIRSIIFQLILLMKTV